MKAVFSLLSFASAVAANCACGYTVNSTHDPNYAIFTELLETDFLHVQSAAHNSSYDVGWIPQNYETSPSKAGGPYGMAKEPSNIVPNYYIENQYNWDGLGVKHGDPGLQFWVRSKSESTSAVRTSPDDLIPSAELVSERDDILYGSFRIAMKTTSVNGTCAGFFFYRNDSQEIDLEILSAQQRSAANSWPIHLVVQNATASTDGVVDYAGEAQKVYNLSSSSAPTQNYNEYRVDWLPDSISYYVNGQHVWTTTENVPTTAGRIHISHWSNGNPLWTGGPPDQDAVLTVIYVKAYFNSTNSTRNHDYRQICSTAGKAWMSETCEIPTQEYPPNPFEINGNETGHTFFFSQQQNMTPGQAVYSSPLESVAWLLSGEAPIQALVVLAAVCLSTSFALSLPALCHWAAVR